MGVGGQRHAPAALPPGKPCTYGIGDWVGPILGLNGCGKSRPPSGFDLRTVHPVEGRYTNWAIPSHEQLLADQKITPTRGK
jgi:hypothetical protein